MYKSQKKRTPIKTAVHRFFSDPERMTVFDSRLADFFVTAGY